MPWVKGQSGNPKGQPRRSAIMARLVRNATEDGATLVAFAVSVLKGEERETIVTKDGAEVSIPASMDHKIEALKWLADRGFGKAVETVEIVDDREGMVMPLAAERLEQGLGPDGALQ